MSAPWFFAGLVWLTLACLAGVLLVQRSPKRRKPVDELEATDAALRNRLVDLEDKFEHYVKRENVRDSRARREVETGQGVLPLDRAARLQAVRERGKARGFQ